MVKYFSFLKQNSGAGRMLASEGSFALLAQLVRAPCSHRGGRWFESSTEHQENLNRKIEVFFLHPTGYDEQCVCRKRARVFCGMFAERDAEKRAHSYARCSIVGEALSNIGQGLDSPS